MQMTEIDDTMERLRKQLAALGGSGDVFAVYTVTQPNDPHADVRADPPPAPPPPEGYVPRPAIADDAAAIEAHRRRLFPNSFV